MTRQSLREMTVLFVILALAGCVAVPGAGTQATSATSAPNAPVVTPGALPPGSLQGATPSAAPGMTPFPLPSAPAVQTGEPAAAATATAASGNYGHAPDYAWLSGVYVVEGKCQKFVYDPGAGDQYGGAVYVTFSGVKAPAGGAFARVYGRF